MLVACAARCAVAAVVTYGKRGENLPGTYWKRGAGVPATCNLTASEEYKDPWSVRRVSSICLLVFHALSILQGLLTGPPALHTSSMGDAPDFGTYGPHPVHALQPYAVLRLGCGCRDVAAARIKVDGCSSKRAMYLPSCFLPPLRHLQSYLKVSSAHRLRLEYWIRILLSIYPSRKPQVCQPSASFFVHTACGRREIPSFAT